MPYYFWLLSLAVVHSICSAPVHHKQEAKRKISKDEGIHHKLETDGFVPDIRALCMAEMKENNGKESKKLLIDLHGKMARHYFKAKYEAAAKAGFDEQTEAGIAAEIERMNFAEAKFHLLKLGHQLPHRNPFTRPTFTWQFEYLNRHNFLLTAEQEYLHKNDNELMDADRQRFKRFEAELKRYEAETIDEAKA